MKSEYIEQLEGCSLGFYVNVDASGFGEDEDLTADDFDQVEYFIKNGKLLSWSWREILDLSDIEDGWWEHAMDDSDYDENDPDAEKPLSWFECFIAELINVVLNDEWPGADEFRNLIDDERILLVLLKDADDNIVEEIDEWDINKYADL